ncbi:MAG: DotU family type IV/VI secretion system protein [Desulfobacteraceae bacterium]
MRLIDCFMPLIVYVTQAEGQVRELQPELETVKNNIDQLLQQSLGIKDKAHFTDQEYNFAHLSVCIWIDEALLNSAWEHKRQWQRELLQRRFHNITDGGQEFFQQLEKIGHEDRDIREVAYYCLTLGLAGRYVEEGDTTILDHLKTSNLKRLYGSSAGEPTLENRLLFPESYQKQAFDPKPKKRPMSWRMVPMLVGLLPVGLFVGLMIFYQYLLRVDLSTFAPM